MKYLHTIIFVFFIVYALDVKISFDPFTIYFTEWKRVLGFCIVGIGLVMLMYNEKEQVFLNGNRHAMDNINEVINQKIDQIKNNHE